DHRDGTELSHVRRDAGPRATPASCAGADPGQELNRGSAPLYFFLPRLSTLVISAERSCMISGVFTRRSMWRALVLSTSWASSTASLATACTSAGRDTSR